MYMTLSPACLTFNMYHDQLVQQSPVKLLKAIMMLRTIFDFSAS